MDAIKFIKEKVRMCDSFAAQGQKCTGCPLAAFDGCDLDDLVDQDRVEEAVELVQEWSAAHPLKTRQDVFLEQYPNSRIDTRDVLRVCPADTYGNQVCPKNGENIRMLCCDCRRKFWSEAVR